MRETRLSGTDGPVKPNPGLPTGYSFFISVKGRLPVLVYSFIEPS